MKIAAAFLLLTNLFLAHGFAATVWDESVNGDFSSSPSAPTSIALGFGANTVIGSIQGPIVTDVSGIDDFTFTVPADAEVFSITLDAYGPDASNISLMNLYEGALGSGTLLGTAILSTLNIDLNLLEAPAATLPIGSLPLGPGDYTIDLREGGEEQEYQITIVVVPEPTSALFLMMAGAVAFITGRRRSFRR